MHEGGQTLCKNRCHISGSCAFGTEGDSAKTSVETRVCKFKRCDRSHVLCSTTTSFGDEHSKNNGEFCVTIPSRSRIGTAQNCLTSDGDSFLVVPATRCQHGTHTQTQTQRQKEERKTLFFWMYTEGTKGTRKTCFGKKVQGKQTWWVFRPGSMFG